MEMEVTDQPFVTCKEKMEAIRKTHPEIGHRFEVGMGYIFSDLFKITNRVDNLCFLLLSLLFAYSIRYYCHTLFHFRFFQAELYEVLVRRFVSDGDKGAVDFLQSLPEHEIDKVIGERY